MTKPVTEKFKEMVLEVETTPGSGTFARICSIQAFSHDRTTNFDEIEVPQDCDDEGLPYDIDLEPRSQSQTISGDGFFAAASHATLIDWWRSAAPKLARVGHLSVTATGATKYEQGPLLLTDLGEARTKGDIVRATMSFRFKGLPELVTVT